MDYLTHDGQRQETLKAIQSLRFKYALARLYDEEVVEIETSPKHIVQSLPFTRSV